MPLIRFQALRGTLASFATDLFARRVGAVTDAPIGERWGWWDGTAWRYAAYSDNAGNVDSESLATSGTVRVDFDGNGSFKALACAEKLQTNGATDPGWGAGWAVNILGPTFAIATEIATGNVSVACNLYHDGTDWRLIVDEADVVPRLTVHNVNGYVYIFSDSATVHTAGQVWSAVLDYSLAPGGDLGISGALTCDGVTIGASPIKTRSFASIYRTAAGVAQSIPSGTTYTKITPFDTNLAGNQDSTPDQANDKIVIGRAGMYETHFSRSYQVGTADVLWHVAVLKNGVVVPNSIQEVASANTSTSYYASVSCHIACAAGDTIEIGVYHDNGTGVNLTYEHATLNVEAID